ncbi:M-phase phosphoprotein 9, partial [Malurus melanocephalus]|uniref:M-phase phosphoprotein 9 n=1 Tax=Malurus melanocephalus TaxID=175006 RepID=UPI0025472E7D
MENCDVVNSVQETPSSSADSDVRNTHSSDCDLNCSRSPSSSANGVSGYSGNTRSSLKPGSVELLASFMQDIQNIGHAHSESLRNCEARWLQLLRLAEKQCQEQIVTQQEQFHRQIQLIQDEIRQLLGLQSSTWSRGLVAELTDTSSAPMGMRSELFEEQESITSQLRSCELESQANACHVQQECAESDASMNSGYGTLSTSELNPATGSASRDTDCMENTPQGLETRPRLDSHAGVDSVQNKRELSPKKTEENSSSGRNDVLVFPAEFEHKGDEDQRGKKPSKSLTSWAQKLRQTQPKRVTADEVCATSMQENERVKRLPLEN